jgi:hypothetical protein
MAKVVQLVQGSHFIEDHNGNIYVSSQIDLIWNFTCSSNSSSTNSSSAPTQATPDAGLRSWEDITIFHQLQDSFPWEQTNPNPEYQAIEATQSYQVTIFHTPESHCTETSTLVSNPTETQTDPPKSQSTTMIQFIQRIFDLTSLPGLLTVLVASCVFLISFGFFVYCCIRRSRRQKSKTDFETQTTFTTSTDSSFSQTQTNHSRSVQSGQSATLFTDTQGKSHFFLSYFIIISLF